VTTSERPFQGFPTSELHDMRRDTEADLRRKQGEMGDLTVAHGSYYDEFMSQLKAIQDHFEKIENELKHRREARLSRERDQQSRPN
jgi:hypothetical protein